MNRLLLTFLLLSFVFSNGHVLAQFQGSTGGGGGGIGSSGGSAFGSNSGMGQGQGGTTSEIPTFGLTAEGSRYDRDARQPGTFVGADSTEISSTSGFIGVLGGNYVNSQTSSSAGGIGGLGGLGSGGLSGRSGSAFGSGVNSARGMTGSRGSSAFGGASSARTGGLGGRTGSLGGGSLGGNNLGGNNFGGTGNFGGQRGGGLGAGTGSFGGSNFGGSNITGQFGNSGRTGTGNRNANNTGFGQGQTGMNGNRSTAQQTINYQTNLKVRFQQPQPAAVASTTVSNLQTRLNVSSRIRKSGNIAVAVRNRTARLSGTVGSERDRQLALGVALLEPGVSSVEDELVVAEQAETLPSPPLSNSQNSSSPSS